MEDWKYYGTYSGCPQGGILSPILANIYLNELDKFVETLKKSFDSNTPYTLTPEYRALQQKGQIQRKRLNDVNDGEERNQLIAHYVELGRNCVKHLPNFAMTRS
ncbi:MAG: hypothetical protein ACLUGJ_11695 [Blautia wexlerae]